MKKAGALIPELLGTIRKKPVTRQYPFVKAVVPEGFRGTPRFDPALCKGCQVCVRDCTAEAIEITQKPPDPNAPPLPEGQKPPRVFFMTLYLDRCVHCARCAEACPTKSIKLYTEFELANFTRDALKLIQN